MKQTNDMGGVPWDRAEMHVLGSIEDHEARLRQAETERTAIANSLKMLALRVTFIGAAVAGGTAYGPKLLKMIVGGE